MCIRDRLGSAQHGEERVRIEVVEAVAALDPEPVPEGDAAAQAERGRERDVVGRREEEQVDDEGDGGDGVEGQVVPESERRCPIGEDELGVNLKRATSKCVRSRQRLFGHPPSASPNRAW